MVLSQYMQLDPSKPPVPINAEGPDVAYALFPEERVDEYGILPSGGVVGTAKNFFRAIGLAVKAAVFAELPKSRKTALIRKRKTLYD